AICDVQPEEADRELGRNRSGNTAHSVLGEIRNISVSAGQTEREESNQHGDFDGGEYVLDACCALQTYDGQDREDGDQRTRHDLSPAELNGPVDGAKQHVRVFRTQRRKEITRVTGKSQRGSGDRRGKTREKRGPSGHEPPGGTKGASKINVFAAGT